MKIRFRHRSKDEKPVETIETPINDTYTLERYNQAVKEIDSFLKRLEAKK